MTGTFPLLLLLLFISASVQGADSPLERHEFVQVRMGVPVRITVYAPNHALAIQATNAAYTRLKELDRCLSDYDPDSELNQFCRQPPGTPVPVSADLWKMLEASQHYFEISDGAFDASVGPLVKRWRIARRKKQIPSPQELAEAQQSVGYQFVQLDSENKTATLLKPNMQLDFGGIAKGYGADEAFSVLESQGLPIALIAVAGEIYAGDPPPGRTGWSVEIEDRGRNPPADHRPALLHLARTAVSTSGDTYQFLELDGVRYSHVLNPKTGIGLTTPGTVTVVSSNCTQTDALDNVLGVLGPEKGLEVLKQYPGTEALFVELKPDGSVAIVKSPGWDRLTTSPAQN